jgi:hypothetical protein
MSHPFEFLPDAAAKAALQALDGELARLLGSLCQSPPEPYGTVASRALGIIRDVEGKLVHQRWEASWDRDESVAWGLFGDVNHDEQSKALHAVFVEVIRYVRSATTPYRQQQYIVQLTDALREYLSLRGYPVPAPAATVTAPPAGPAKGKRGSVNQRMLEQLQADPDSVEWSQRRWADYLRCTPSAVAKAPAWKTIMKTRALAMASRLGRQRR